MTKETILKKEMSVKYCSSTRFDYLDDDELPLIYKAMDQYATAQTAELQKEVERLKGLIEIAHIHGWNTGRGSGDSFVSGAHSWQQFKTDNNL